MSREISLKILLQASVDGTMYGIQKGKGSNYEIVQTQLGNGEDLVFDFTIQGKVANESLTNLTGPYVQGPAANRFIYIGIGSYAGQTGALYSGRLKVPLSKADFQNIVSDSGGDCWYCIVPGRNKDGKPVFATVKSFRGWTKSKAAGFAGE